MALVVLGAWLVQAIVGSVLLAGWWRHGRASLPMVVAHVAPAVLALGLWVMFVVDESVAWGWASFAAITVGNTFGDQLLIGRSRRLHGRRSFRADYGTAVGAVLRRRFPRPVTFHALFAGVVYFGSLAVCILGSV